jgi:O-methyltransferase domain
VTAMPEALPGREAQTAIWEIVRGAWRYPALHAFVRLACADHLGAGPATTEQLARLCDADPASLARLLRCCASMGVVEVTGDGSWGLTAPGLTLRSGGSMRAAVLNGGNPASWESMLHLATAVRTGQPVFEDIIGVDFYEWQAAHPDYGQIFQEFMIARSAEAAAVIAGLDISDTSVLADIGGGRGTILAAVLEAHPHLRGILFERSEVLQGARDHLAGRGLDGRCEVVLGDFFDAATIPAADGYILANILHNYTDDDARTILRNITASSPGARFILADILLPDDPAESHMGTDLDMRRLATGGRERVRGEYIALLDSVGLTVSDILPTATMLSVIDAKHTGAALSPPHKVHSCASWWSTRGRAA